MSNLISNARRTSLSLVALLAGTTAAVCAPAAARAQDAALPEGKAVIEKYIEATGGRAAHEKVRTRVVNSTLDIPAAGIKGTSQSYNAAPNKVYIVVDLGAAGREERGSDGTVVWEKTTTGGPRVINDPKELAFWRRAFDIDSDLRLDEYYSSVETKGVEDVNGKPAYKVELTAKSGGTETRYYDKDSGLLVKAQQVVPTPMGQIPSVSMPSDYRDVDGVKIPHKAEETIAGQVKINATLDKVEHNADIPAEKFQLPPDVKVLVDKAAAAPTTQPK
jgi:hypothetical protein